MAVKINPPSAEPSGIPQLIRPNDLAAKLGIEPNTLFIWIKRGIIPRPIKLSKRAAAWKVETINAWLAEREAANTK